jgi:hypothetical protein
MVSNKRYEELQESVWRAKKYYIEHIRELEKENLEMKSEIIRVCGACREAINKAEKYMQMYCDEKQKNLELAEIVKRLEGESNE